MCIVFSLTLTIKNEFLKFYTKNNLQWQTITLIKYYKVLCRFLLYGMMEHVEVQLTLTLSIMTLKRHQEWSVLMGQEALIWMMSMSRPIETVRNMNILHWGSGILFNLWACYREGIGYLMHCQKISITIYYKSL